MKNSFVTMVYILLLSVICLIGCQNPGSVPTADAASNTSATATPEPAPVEIEPVQLGSIANYLETTSNLYADSQVNVLPKISGQIQSIRVEEGDSVKQGQVLAVIDDDEYALRLRQVEVTWNQAKEKQERLRQMYENQMTSQESYNDALYATEEAAVAYQLAKLDLEHTRVRSPIAGIVTEKSINQGDLVTVSTTTFQVVDQNSLMIDVHLPEREVMNLRKELTAEVLPGALPGRTFHAVIKRIHPVVDPRTGTVKITLTAQGSWSELSAGMFVRVRILIEQKNNVVLLPKRALIHSQEHATAYVMNDENIAEKRHLNLGLENSEWFEVLTGIEDGENLIIVGQHNLEDGQTVKLLNGHSSELTPDAEPDSEPIPDTTPEITA